MAIRKEGILTHEDSEHKEKKKEKELHGTKNRSKECFYAKKYGPGGHNLKKLIKEKRV